MVFALSRRLAKELTPWESAPLGDEAPPRAGISHQAPPDLDVNLAIAAPFGRVLDYNPRPRISRNTGI